MNVFYLSKIKHIITAYKARWISFLIILIVLLLANMQIGVAASAPSDFTDVPAGSWYADPVAWAISRGITNGTSSSTFSPEATCTNAQVLTFLWRACGSIDPTITNPFRDISESDYFYKPALWAYEKDMVDGDYFQPNKPCSRSMAVTYLWKEAGSPETLPNLKFTDVSADNAQAVSWAVDMGITLGTSTSKFSPESICNRAQIITFLYRELADDSVFEIDNDYLNITN